MSQDDGQNEKQAASFAPGVLLKPRGAPQLVIGTTGIVPHVDGVGLYRLELLALLSHDLRNLLEEDIQVTDALLNMPNLVLAFSDEGILEVDLVLRGQMDLFLLLQLKLLAMLPRDAGGVTGIVVKCTLGCRDGGTLFLEGCALKGLKFGEGSFEFAGEFLLGVFLRRLY
ncbi:hypothetical protein RRF57_009925 [Xylaria bambusicola]|uniref:Uncharacterized protein n=1 Tax=Xylaria bambusicola TaxID=326684 RepID=A0AAN7UXK5_9PEZI